MGCCAQAEGVLEPLRGYVADARMPRIRYLVVDSLGLDASSPRPAALTAIASGTAVLHRIDEATTGGRFVARGSLIAPERAIARHKVVEMLVVGVSSPGAGTTEGYVVIEGAFKRELLVAPRTSQGHAVVALGPEVLAVDRMGLRPLSPCTCDCS